MAPHLADRFHALLIGIDFYLPNRLSEGSYPRLRGCVEDTRCVYDYLRQDLGIAKERIERLTASYTGGNEPPEPREKWPTYERMTEALKRLGESARPGDQVLFYYSGHGGRTPTSWPELKTEEGLDECLVPLDIGKSQTRYLRDVEIARVIRNLADRDLRFIMVFDCCHSGGGSRDFSQVQARGASFVDTTRRPSDSLLATDVELLDAWHQLTRGGTRNLLLGSGWLPEYPGFTFLAACRESELAFEDRFAGRFRGVFTYWWLDSLRRLGLGVTYKRLHDRLLAKVHSKFETQTPVLEGESAQLIFGEDTGRVQRAARVLSIDLENEQLLLNVGRAQGVAPGACFAIHAASAEDLGDHETRLALVEVTDQIDAAQCHARILDRYHREIELEDDSQAVLVDVGDVRLRRAVCCLPGVFFPEALIEFDQKILQSGFLELASDDRPADFLVTPAASGAVVSDPAGEVLIHIGPTPDPKAVAGQLVHLAKYRNVQELLNDDGRSRLQGLLTVDLARLPNGYERNQTIVRDDLEPLTSPAIVREGDWLCITLRNRGKKRFNYVVLDLQPSWSIQQVIPRPLFTTYLTLEGGAETRLPLQASIAEGARHGRDLLKVFATCDTTDFRWLELPRLGEPPLPACKNFPTNPLEQLLQQVATTPPATRALSPRPQASAEWTVAQVEVMTIDR